MPKDKKYGDSIVGDKGQYSGSTADVLRKALAGGGKRPDKPRTLGELGSAAGTDPDKLLKRVFGE